MTVDSKSIKEHVLIYESDGKCGDYVIFYKNGKYFRKAYPYIGSPNRFSLLSDQMSSAIPKPEFCKENPARCWLTEDGDVYKIEVYNNGSTESCHTVTVTIKLKFSPDCAAKNLKPVLQRPSITDSIFAEREYPFVYHIPGSKSDCDVGSEALEIFTSQTDPTFKETFEVKNDNKEKKLTISRGDLYSWVVRMYWADNSFIDSSARDLCVHSQPDDVEFVSPIEGGVQDRVVTFNWKVPKLRQTCGHTYDLTYKLQIRNNGNWDTITSVQQTRFQYTFLTDVLSVDYRMSVDVNWSGGISGIQTQEMSEHKLWFCSGSPNRGNFAITAASADAPSFSWTAADFSACPDAGSYAVYIGNGGVFDVYAKDIKTTTQTTKPLPAGNYEWFVVAYYGSLESGRSISSNIASYTKGVKISDPVLISPLSNSNLSLKGNPKIKFRWQQLSLWGKGTDDTKQKFSLTVAGKSVGKFPFSTLQYEYDASSLSSGDVEWSIEATNEMSHESSKSTGQFKFCKNTPPSISGDTYMNYHGNTAILHIPDFDTGECCGTCNLVAHVTIGQDEYQVHIENAGDYPVAAVTPGETEWSAFLSNGLNSSIVNGKFTVLDNDIELTNPKNGATVELNSNVIFSFGTYKSHAHCQLMIGEDPDNLKSDTVITTGVQTIKTFSSQGTIYWKIQCGVFSSAVWSLHVGSCTGKELAPVPISPVAGEDLMEQETYTFIIDGTFFPPCSMSSNHILSFVVDDESEDRAAVGGSEVVFNKKLLPGVHTWMVCLKSVEPPLEILCSEHIAFSTCRTATNQPKLVSPVQDAVITSSVITLQWNPMTTCVSSSSSQILYIVTPATTIAVPLRPETSTFEYTLSSESRETAQWHVSAVLPFNQHHDSSTWTFKTCKTTLDPPILAGVPDSIETVELRWSMDTKDVCNDITKNMNYIVSVSSQDGDPLIEFMTNTTSYTGNLGFTSSKYFLWTVRAIAQIGSTKYQSETSVQSFGFICISSPPLATEYYYPQDDSTITSGNSVAFKWKETFFGTECKSSTGAMQYIFSLDGSPTSIRVTSLNTGGTYTHVVNSNLAQGEHTWSVDKVVGSKKTAGAVQTFRVCDAATPYAPTQLSSDATRYPVTLKWSSAGCNSQCTEYCSGEVFLSKKQDGSNKASYGIGNEELSIAPPSGIYYWSVQLNNGISRGSFAEWQEIIVCRPQAPGPLTVTSACESDIFTLGASETCEVKFEHPDGWKNDCPNSSTNSDKRWYSLRYYNLYTKSYTTTSKRLSEPEPFSFSLSEIPNVGNTLVQVVATNEFDLESVDYFGILVCNSNPKAAVPRSPTGRTSTVNIPFEWSEVGLNEAGYSCNPGEYDPAFRIYVYRANAADDGVLLMSSKIGTTQKVSTKRLNTSTEYDWDVVTYVDSEHTSSARRRLSIRTKDEDCTTIACTSNAFGCTETNTGASCDCISGYRGKLCDKSEAARMGLIAVAIVVPIVVVLVALVVYLYVKYHRTRVSFKFVKPNFEAIRFEPFPNVSGAAPSPKTQSLFSTDYNSKFVTSIQLVMKSSTPDVVIRALLYAWAHEKRGVEFAAALISSELYLHSSEGKIPENSSAVKVFYYFARMVGAQYLWSTYRSTFERILSSELKRRNITYVIKDEPTTAALDSFDSFSSETWDTSESFDETESLNIRYQSQQIVAALTASESRTPPELCKLLSDVKTGFLSLCPSQSIAEPLTFLFLQHFVLASLRSPKHYGVFCGVPAELKEFLKLVVSFVSAAGSRKAVGTEMLEICSQSFIDDNAEKVEAFFLDLCDKGEDVATESIAIPGDIYSCAIAVINAEQERSARSSGVQSSSFNSFNSPISAPSYGSFDSPFTGVQYGSSNGNRGQSRPPPVPQRRQARPPCPPPM